MGFPSFKISTYNANGLNDVQKRKDVFNYIRDLDKDIFFLQETHLKEELEKYVRAEWGYELWLAGKETNRKGVAILFKPTFEYKMFKVVKDPLGCYIIIDIEILNKRMSLVNIYGPSAGDNPDFFIEIENKIHHIGNDLNVIGGDFNCILDVAMDAKNYKSENNRPKARQKIKEIMANN